MDIRTIIDKVSSTVVAAISGYIAIDGGVSLPGVLGASGTTAVAFFIAYYIYKDAGANSRMKHAQAAQIEIANKKLELEYQIEKRRMDGNHDAPKE